ncbi:uncharacterized protein LOC115453116 isoform X2 [Manduca sexta]|uniref:Uncharacterized protein n=1 Tax=Manduca sexta TaxID=7130 RepID=A0A922CE48_MANSE|nr:uncharacterized protein LOC115453116 isoform X2 [Manduca sexta]KAG6442549.1 hypothetical protein O3G_MSEX002409 [Manduca sexta]
MDVYKDFFLRIRRLSLEDPCILIHDSIWPKLKEFVQLLINVTLEDGTYHIYVGKIKRILSSFHIYFKVTMDAVLKESDRCSKVLNKDELLDLMENTMHIHETNQINFGKDFLPVNSREEREAYEEIEAKYHAYMEKLHEIKAGINKFDKQFKVDDFCKNHFKITVNKTSRLFNYTQSYLAVMLADRLEQICVSIEEILLRMRNNLQRETEAANEYQNKLLHELYDKNKEQLAISRRYRKCSVDGAEVGRSIEILREKIENCESTTHLSRLKEEVDYWTLKVREFHEIADVIKKLKHEQENCAKQEGIFNKMDTELPGCKLAAWNFIGSTFRCQQIYLREKFIKACRSLFTYFTCKGSDRICYMDNVGRYYVDDYNHQVYPVDYALKIYHLNCNGEFRECPETDIYYFDESGRHIYKDGEKIYQCAPCTSHYKLADNHLLTKVTQDCGHSEKMNEACRLDIRDPTVVELLPTTITKDIKKSLSSDVVKYLWDSFGGLLPDALHDVAMAKPNNPIHILAHKLLWHKYGRTTNEVKKKSEKARAYRENIFKERREKAAAQSRLWKSKQVKRRKPEESDDAQDLAVYSAQVAQHDFINSLNYYN